MNVSGGSLYELMLHASHKLMRKICYTRAYKQTYETIFSRMFVGSYEQIDHAQTNQ